MRATTMHRMILLIPALVAGCASPFRVDYEPTQDFRLYQSYAWAEPNAPGYDALAGDPLMRRRLVQAVDRVLGEQGYAQVTEGADCRVSLHGTLSRRTTVHEGLGVGYGLYGPTGILGRRHLDISTYDELTLILDIRDGTRGDLVWRGWVTQVPRSYRSPQRAAAAAERLACGLLANFPPESTD